MLTAVSCSNTGQQSISEPSGNVNNVEQSKEDIILTYATYTEPHSTMQEMIDNFNDENNGYKVVIKDYSEGLVYENPETKGGASEESLSAVQIEIVQDIIKGEVDIINSESIPNNITFENLKNKEAFADLYPFMENDPDVNRSVLNETVLNLSEIDGKLYSLPTFYEIDTLIGESQYVGTKENWTFDEFVSHWEQMPDGSTIAGHTEKLYVYINILRNTLEEFVDYKNGTASFDSPEFIELLEFCNRFDYVERGTKVDSDSNSPDFVTPHTISGIWNFHKFIKETDTLVGYPSSDGTGAYIDTSHSYNFAINKSSSAEKQEGAWNFIRRFADEEYQTSKYVYYDDSGKEAFYWDEIGIPINDNVFEKMSKEIMDGKIYSNIISSQGQEYDIGLPTQEEYNRLVKYISNVKRKKTNDFSLHLIIDDDIDAYFKGEKTIEETVEIIQNRVSIMVSEKS